MPLDIYKHGKRHVPPSIPDPRTITPDSHDKLTPITEPLMKFTVFPKLPIELRFKIWRLSLPGARLVKAIFRPNDRQFRSAARIPTALHTCCESRQEALKVYKLSFGHPSFHTDTKVLPNRIYFDFEIDTFYPHTIEPGCESRIEDIGRDTGLLIVLLKAVEDRLKVKRVAIDIAYTKSIDAKPHRGNGRVRYCLPFGDLEKAPLFIDEDNLSGVDLGLEVWERGDNGPLLDMMGTHKDDEFVWDLAVAVGKDR